MKDIREIIEHLIATNEEYFSEIKKLDVNELKEKYANSLKRLRKAFNYSLTDIEKMTGIANQVISRYELGKNIPNILHAHKLSLIFGMSINAMIDGDFDEYKQADSFNILKI